MRDQRTTADGLRPGFVGFGLVTTVLDAAYVASRVADIAPDSIEEIAGEEIFVKPERIAEVCRGLRDDGEFDLKMLRGLDIVDHVDRFELRYALLSIAKNHEVVLKARLWGRDGPSIPSVVDVWEGANLQEREIYDLMGITFEGHPNMKRVLLWEGFPGHPLRKDFP